MHRSTKPADLEDIASACGLTTIPLSLTKDQLARLQRAADRQGIGWEEYARRIIATKLQEEGLIKRASRPGRLLLACAKA